MPKKYFINYVLAGYPVLWIDTYEEYRAMTVFAQEISNTKNKYSLFSWDRIDGIKTMALKDGLLGSAKLNEEGLDDPLVALGWFEKSNDNGVLFLKDFHRYIDKEPIYRKVRNLISYFKATNKVLAILSHTVKIPAELEKEITVVSFSLPDREELRRTLKAVCDSASDIKKCDYPKEDISILNAALGMTSFEAENAFSVSLVEKKCFDAKIICREKAAVVKKTGLMEVMEVDNTVKDIGGLDNLKEWLQARASCFSEKAKTFGIKPPKGVLLVGIPGTGKSLAAKCSSDILSRPLLRLDMGKIYGSYVGESESNMHKCLNIAEAIAPCVLFIDELEKSFSGSKGSSDSHEVSKRVFATFLTWLQDKTADVFIIATANNVQALPPELMRSGRFDSIFWVDVPDTIEQRKEILDIHLRRRGHTNGKLDRDLLATKCDGHTGAEIESWVEEALVHAFQAGHDLTNEDFIEALKEITCISTLMKDDIDGARKWAKDHGVKYASVKKQEEEITPKRKISFN